jgi:hypothetical protein
MTLGAADEHQSSASHPHAEDRLFYRTAEEAVSAGHINNDADVR